MRMYDLRDYSMAAVKLYNKSGVLEESLIDDFKRTAESTIAPTPVVVDLVGSPMELTASVQENRAATFVRSTSLKRVFCDGLRWTNQYDSLAVSVSDGPIVSVWPTSWRAYVFGCERFATGRSLMPTPIVVSPRAGDGAPLTEVKISNGRELFQRYVLNSTAAADGSSAAFDRTLLLDGFVHRNLVLEATNADGHTAVANLARSWKAGSTAVIFCGDHTNVSNPAVCRAPVDLDPPNPHSFVEDRSG